MANPTQVYLGIDVSAAHLDLAASSGGEEQRFTNDPEGIRALTERVGGMGPTLVVMEATGGMELPVAGELSTAGVEVVVVNPRQVRDFARATGKLANTDALDARMLARFGEAVKPRYGPSPTPLCGNCVG